MDNDGLGFRTILLLGVLIWGVVMIAGMAISCSQEHSHPPQDQEIHDRFYEGWMVPPKRESSCCNKQDCYPTEFKSVGGTWFALRREDGEWIPIPAAVLEDNTLDPRDSPDGRNHVCMQAPGSSNRVYCAVRGGGM